MVSAGDFRKGTPFEMDDKIYRVVEFLHVKPGKGSAFVRTKIKNIMTGQVVEKTFSPSEKFNIAHVERRDMTYLYEDAGLYYFMDNSTYEQIPLNKDQVEDTLNYVVENSTATISFHKGNAFAVEPPTFVDLEIIESEPGIQGDTSKASFKPAKLETGLVIQVPLFVNSGDKIRVDTRTGTYSERL